MANDVTSLAGSHVAHCGMMSLPVLLQVIKHSEAQVDEVSVGATPISSTLGTRKSGQPIAGPKCVRKGPDAVIQTLGAQR